MLNCKFSPQASKIQILWWVNEFIPLISSGHWSVMLWCTFTGSQSVNIKCSGISWVITCYQNWQKFDKIVINEFTNLIMSVKLSNLFHCNRYPVFYIFQILKLWCWCNMWLEINWFWILSKWVIVDGSMLMTGHIHFSTRISNIL